MRPADLPGDELAAVAYLAEQERLRSGGPTWDRPGVLAALRRSNHQDLPTMLAAVLNAASDPGAHSPGAMHLTRYQPRAWKNPSSSSANPICRTCQLPEPACRRMAKKTEDPHTFQTRSTR